MGVSTSFSEFFVRLRNALPSRRIFAIDFVRGVVVILMALDHASVFWNPYHGGGEGLQGFRPSYPDLFYFFVRFVSHYCAPAFIFLAGTSITLSAVNRLEREETQFSITQHLIIRGLVLLLIEWTIISWIFKAAPLYFGVLACIGVGFIIFAWARRLPSSILLFLSAGILVLGPFVWFETSTNEISYFLVAIYKPIWPYGVYPLIPWIAVMGLGVLFGRWLLTQQNLSNSNKRITQRLFFLGIFCNILFFIFRIYSMLPMLPNVEAGWPVNYIPAESFVIEDFFLIAKYPPSIVFLLLTLGGMLLLLALGFTLQDRIHGQLWITPVVLLGATPLFFYCIHLYLYGLVPTLSYSQPILAPLVITIIVWLIGLLTLIPLCLLYQEIKNKYPTSVLKYI